MSHKERQKLTHRIVDLSMQLCSESRRNLAITRTQLEQAWDRIEQSKRLLTRPHTNAHGVEDELL